ncbi:DUF1659 domain-containing protein [Bacillaceae bacterium S4-13-58]
MAGVLVTNSRLQLTFENGVNEKGDVVFKSKAFNQVKTTASNDGLYAVANALAPLQQLPLHAIERQDTMLLTEM